ncbi:GIY-YIG nuclease family protein [Candidatus Pelagibacter sp.]|nr:GIY-YIG nuclease family protein [Candidatus Pelagibacter sp.]
MSYYVYLLLSKKLNSYISYVGYTKNIKKRLALHNSSKGAKFTRGRRWFLIYKKKYISKSKAMKEEYRLKKNYKLRKDLKENFLINK